MRTFELSHLSDRKLLEDLGTLVSQDRRTTAALLAHIAEVDARRLFAPRGHESMFRYCVDELRLSDDAAYKRIQAARTARKFPALFQVVAEGRLHLTAVNLLAPFLIQENAKELIRAAAGKTKSEIEELLAHRYPRTEPMALEVQLAPAQVDKRQSSIHPERTELAPAQVERGRTESLSDRTKLAPAQVGAPAYRSTVEPIAAQRFVIQVAIDQATREKLRHAQALLSHKLPSGDIAAVLDLALDALVAQLEKRKFAATEKPRTIARPSTSRRTIPARVKRAVWQRDGGRCTFVGHDGHRCAAQRFIEYDHVEPVARGGEATIENLRLRCRAHNQLAADEAFGGEFMGEKRGDARRAKEAERVAASTRDVISALRHLGYRAGEAREAAEFSRELAGDSLEKRLRLALSYFRPRVRKAA